MSLEISLPVEMEQQLLERVASGQFGSASEYVCQAMKLLETQLQNAELAKLTALKSDIARGVEDVQLGRVEVIDIETIKQRGRALLAAKVKA